MNQNLIEEIKALNPWLEDKSALKQIVTEKYLPRIQANYLMRKEWDALWMILVGPRQSGKTTLGKHLCYQLIKEKRFNDLIYLNCDLSSIREWISGIAFLNQLQNYFNLKNYILFIDEVQRLESPGLLLKAIFDLNLPIKLIASGSSQLEIKSKVQEHLTGRHIEATILPFSQKELPKNYSFDNQLIFGNYPQIVASKSKNELLQQLYNVYINKDIIEILKLRNADLVEKLIGLIAHSSGQLVNFQQLATDTKSTVPTVQQYISILIKTYVLFEVRPFVGNKRQELTSNPVYYFIDNGFRNMGLNNFSNPEQRTDIGLLVENFILQSILKYRIQNFKDFKINYWRTKGGAEIDFIIQFDAENLIPIEVKYRNFNKPKITRAFRSFLETYQPKIGFIITKDYYAEEIILDCKINWIPANEINFCNLDL